MNSKKTRNRKKVEKTISVNENRKQQLSIKQIIAICVLSGALFLIVNVKNIVDCVNGLVNFWDVFFTEFKDLVYSVGFSIIVYIVVNVSNVANKKKK